MSQWSTLESGPLAPLKSAATGSKARKRCEPVVHSLEWTTSSLGKGRNWGQKPEKSCASGPLFGVDHWLPGTRQQPGRNPEKATSPNTTIPLSLRTNESARADQDFLATRAA